MNISKNRVYFKNKFQHNYISNLLFVERTEFKYIFRDNFIPDTKLYCFHTIRERNVS